MNENVNITTGTIFDENGYDEMQKTENHEIGFRLFRIMFFVVLGFAAALVIVCGTAENAAGMYISLALVAVVFGFYVLYAFMTAKRGIMNPKFAKSWAAKWVIIAYIVLLLLWVYRLFSIVNGERKLSDIANCVMWLIMCSEAMLMSLCAKKNMRVLKKQLEEDE